MIISDSRTLRANPLFDPNFKKTMNFYLDFNVKFRIFGITLGSVHETLDVTLDLVTKAVTWKFSPVQPPAGAKALFDQRGVKITVWA